MEVGELACHTLVVAEDASTLSFITHENESIVAERSSYTTTSGDAFTDGIIRKVCVLLWVCFAVNISDDIRHIYTPVCVRAFVCILEDFLLCWSIRHPTYPVSSDRPGFASQRG